MTWSRSASSIRPIRCANISESKTDRSSSESNDRPTTTRLRNSGSSPAPDETLASSGRLPRVATTGPPTIGIIRST